ncbi:MAG: hypothetical protein HYY76_13350 [Acidobacteria bacterium]|nr:hypothetical protein [Acidobacteriota bacterium]
MTIRLLSLALIGSAALWMPPALAAGQTPASGQGAYMPARLPDGQPDIQGSWRADPGGSYSVEYMGLQPLGGGGFGDKPPVKGGGSRVVDPPDGRIPYQPWAAAKALEIFNDHMNPRPDQLDPQGRCWLQGVVRTTYQSGFQILQTPGQVVFVINWGHSYRVIPLDGKPHIAENLKLFMGDSRGRWEGNTLVVDVANNNHLTWFDVVGSFHSDALRVVQRYTIVDANTMNYEATIDDQKVYTRPWKMAFRLRRNPEPDEVWEEACHEGNRSLQTILSRPRTSSP